MIEISNGAGFSSMTQSSGAMVTPIVVGETYLLSISFQNISVDGKIQIECGGKTLSLVPSGFCQLTSD